MTDKFPIESQGLTSLDCSWATTVLLAGAYAWFKNCSVLSSVHTSFSNGVYSFKALEALEELWAPSKHPAFDSLVSSKYQGP